MRVFLWIILTIIVVPFQNCTFTSPIGNEASPSRKGSAMAGGGTGFDGRVSYINVAPTSCPDGSVLKSLIHVEADVAIVERENCQALASGPRLSRADIGLMPHNEENALRQGLVHDRLTTETDPSSEVSVATKFLCRGTYPNKSTKETQAADVIIKGSSAPSHARVIMAVYSEDGVLSERLDSGDLALRNISTEVVGRVKYVSNTEGRFAITLWIDKEGETRTGKLSFMDGDIERVIQNLQCFSQ